MRVCVLLAHNDLFLDLTPLTRVWDLWGKGWSPFKLSLTPSTSPLCLVSEWTIAYILNEARTKLQVFLFCVQRNQGYERKVNIFESQQQNAIRTSSSGHSAQWASAIPTSGHLHGEQGTVARPHRQFHKTTRKWLISYEWFPKVKTHLIHVQFSLI